MTGYTVHTGSSDDFAEGWDRIFKDSSKKKSTEKKKPTKSQKATGKKKKKSK